MSFNKKELRALYLEKRQRLTIEQVRQTSTAITERVLRLKELESKLQILTYIPTQNEVDTTQLINALLKRGAAIFLPAYRVDEKQYTITQFGGWDELEEGPYHILQPKDLTLVKTNIIEVVILPGVTFDKIGVRLGYGRGVFDKLLSKSHALKIGLAFDFQIVNKLPREPHDLVMDIIITEKRILRGVE